MPRGRPDTYTPEMGKRICEAIAVSQSGLRSTLERDPELPAYGTMLEWLRRHPDLSRDYALAKTEQINSMAEDIIDLANSDELDPNDKRIRIDARKWLLSKLIPKTYGDKLDVTSGGDKLPANSALVDARIQSIIMMAQQRKLEEMKAIDLTPEAKSLLD